MTFSCNTSSTSQIVDVLDINLKLDNGILFYDEVPFKGILVSYYDPENLKSKIEYADGKKHGLETQWYRNGDKMIERFYREGFKTGIHKSWWQDGTQKFEYHFNEKGEFHGIVKEWYKNAQIFRDFNYVDGKELGSQRMWKNDGTIKANYEVVNGERFGLIGLKKCYTVKENEDEIK
ncbi:hypothetical protein [Algibacter sp. 2305UL17-15]|uniref:toxin-antitoxin system YwqK family antitoxin n=1 Tax=Algibacter sp. 2305UL17-15 TaxID=3231268 RepID=UPI0034587384